MNTWTVIDLDGNPYVVEADKVIVSDSGVLMFFNSVGATNLMVSAFQAWESCELSGD